MVKYGFRFQLNHHAQRRLWLIRDATGAEVLAMPGANGTDARLTWITMEWPDLADITRAVIAQNAELTWPALTGALLVLGYQVRQTDDSLTHFTTLRSLSDVGSHLRMHVSIPKGGPPTCVDSYGYTCTHRHPMGPGRPKVCCHMLAAFLYKRTIVKGLEHPKAE